MKKILFLLLALCGCSCSSLNLAAGGFKPTDDEDARDVQLLMLSTVKVNMSADAVVDGVTVDDLSWAGSGTVIDVDRGVGVLGESLVLTAGHVCHVPSDMTQPIKLSIKNPRFAVTNVLGTVMVATPIYVSFDDTGDHPEVPDVCVLKVDGVPGPRVTLATELPPIGALIQNVGAPMGFRQNGGFYASDGRFASQKSGFTNKLLFVTVPAVGGLSGSGLFYHGKLFGVLVMGSEKFEHITLGTDLDDALTAVTAAEKAWGN